MPYCHVPWTHIDISPQGEISPCCKFKNSVYPYKVSNINEITIDEYLVSQTLKEVKQDFNNNVWPKGCERCKIEEENGLESRRVSEYKRFEKYLNNHQNKGLLSASIAFGNTCNLTCIICDPTASSKWFQEYKKLYGVSIKPNHFYKKDFVDNFYSKTENLIHLDIPGGEPLLSGVEQQLELLQKLVDDNKAKDITLHYHTNCTYLPTQQWLELWSNFKEVEIQLSIDGINDRFSYIRYPADWDKVHKNALAYKTYTQTYPNLRLGISTTVSAYNIAYLPELYEWIINTEIKHPYFGRLHNPMHLRPTVWPSKAKEFIIERLNNYEIFEPFVNLLINEDDSKHFDTFKYRLLRHDNYRKLNFSKTFPEMAQFL